MRKSEILAFQNNHKTIQKSAPSSVPGVADQLAENICRKYCSIYFREGGPGTKNPQFSYFVEGYVGLIFRSWEHFSQFEPRSKNNIEKKRKNAKTRDFDLPKQTQNRPKILSKSRFQKTCDIS